METYIFLGILSIGALAVIEEAVYLYIKAKRVKKNNAK